MNARQGQGQADPAATETKQDSDFLRLINDRKIAYTPQGETDQIELSVSLVEQYLVKPTKSGAMPSKQDVTKFVMLCKARQLNPWVGDAFLVGYDGKDGPEYSLITSVHALHKRADRCPEYDGLTAGIIVKTADGIQELPGAFIPDGATLLGGWAAVKRKDRSEPYYTSVRLQSYDKGRSLWNSDKAGMIRKCAIAGALREAFPNQTSGLYTTDELPAMVASATRDLTEQRPQATLSEAAKAARADLDRMLDKPVGDKPAHDLPPTPQPDDSGPPDPIAECSAAIDALTTAPAPASLVAQAMDFGLTEKLDDKLKAIAFKAGQRRQRPLPGE